MRMGILLTRPLLTVADVQPTHHGARLPVNQSSLNDLLLWLLTLTVRGEGLIDCPALCRVASIIPSKIYHAIWRIVFSDLLTCCRLFVTCLVDNGRGASIAASLTAVSLFPKIYSEVITVEADPWISLDSFS